MVRVVCQNFQRPRSRHSSGESPYSVDTDLARRAAEVLSTMTTSEGRRSDSDTETSSDVCWDSDGGAGWDVGTSDSGAELVKNQNDLVKKRKARRRERNKVSAQAYRQRRKEQALSQQKILTQLEEHQRDLLEQIRQLELEKVQVEKFLRSCFADRTTAEKTETPEAPQTVPVALVSNYHHDHHDHHGHHNNNNNPCHRSNIPEIMSMS